MSSARHQGATGQPSCPESQNEVSRDSQQARAGKEKAEAQVAYLSSSDSRAPDTMGIQRRTLECLALFESCQKNPHLSGDDWIDKMSAEFNWWSLGIGAAKGGHSSLDYRVQARDDVRKVLVNLLDSLATSLAKYIDAASQHRNSLQATPTPTQEQHLGEASTRDSDPQPSGGDSLIDEQRYYIKTTIQFLSQISIAIRKSGTKFRHQRVDKLLAARESELKDFRDYLRYLVLMSPRKVHGLHGVSLQHTLTDDPNWKNLWIMIKAYFTDTGRLTPVQDRLIKANLVRRNRFDLYLERYHQRMQGRKGSQLLPVQAETATISPPKEPLIPAASQSHLSQTPPKPSEKKPIQLLLIEGSQRSSQSATKIGSFVMPERPREQKAKSVSTKQSLGVLKQDYPKCPGAEGESFWCPYCAQLLDSSFSDPKKNKRWRGHVAEDLNPYVCVYDDCDSPDSMYVTTTEWKKHIGDSHSRARWICDPCWLNSDSPEEFEYDSQEEWHKHTLAEHEGEVDESDLSDLAELSQRTGVPPIACPLCHEDATLRSPETDKHLAEHIHSFALQALPWEPIGPDDETKVSMGSEIRKLHDSRDSEQSTTGEPQDDDDDDDEITAFQNLVSTIRSQSGMILRKSHYHPATSVSVLLVTIQTYLSRPSVQFYGYHPSFRPEILACLARLGSIMQGHEGQSSDPKEQESVDMWEEDLAQVFKYFQHLESLSGLESPAPSGSSVATLGAQLGEQLGRLKLQFHGQDGTGREISYYIPRHGLEAFWEARNINAILRAYSVNKSRDVILERFLCTFSLLVYIHKVEFLGWLVERNIKDATFPLEARPSAWPDTPPHLELFEAITKSQWIFFPVTFEQHGLYNQVFSPQHIFPICTEELIKAGDIIQVHKIETNPSCAGSGPVRSTLAAYFEFTAYPYQRQATYVRKSYDESGKSQYEREVKTFTSLQIRASPNIISYHGCYQQKRLGGTITYNLILGFVEGENLEEFYTTMSPPNSLPDANKIWKAFSGVLEGLHQLHSASIDTGFQTIHQDIKPENLLVSKPTSSRSYDIGLVIIDFGYSHTKALTTGQDTWGIDLHGGQVYGAPEASHHADYRRLGRTPITPKVDIWSLGCVMSEVAIWIKCGRQGLEKYRKNRIDETRTLPRFDEAGHGGCFHDGAEALRTVRTSHNWIHDNFPDDVVILQVLEMIDKSMLVPQGDRQDAQMLCERLAKIVQATSSAHEYNSPPSKSLSVNSPPHIPTRPVSFGSPWTPPTRGRSQATTIKTTPVIPQSPISTSTTESPGFELYGTDPQEVSPPLRSDWRLPSTSFPVLTFDQAREWYLHSKNSGPPVDPRVQDVVGQLGNNVRGRDHIFLVDVSPSMGLHAHEITERFKILAYLAKKFNPDGVELCFSSEVPLIHKGDTSKLLRKFNNQKWDQLSFEDRIGTFIDRIVISRLLSWHRKLGLTKPKNLTIFVLTDGKWGYGREGAAGVENPIIRLINVIRREELSRTQVAIQFLRFGDDPDGKRYLRYLDHYGKEYNCDCVDTVPIDGNIFDMFIGPISTNMDGIDGVHEDGL